MSFGNSNLSGAQFPSVGEAHAYSEVGTGGHSSIAMKRQKVYTAPRKALSLAARSSSVQERISNGEDHWSYHV